MAALTSTGPSAFEWTEPGCGFGAADVTRHRTFVDIVVDDPSRPLLLDAWLLPTGDRLPDESAERVTDARALPPGQGALRVQVSTPGAFRACQRAKPSTQAGGPSRAAGGTAGSISTFA